MSLDGNNWGLEDVTPLEVLSAVWWIQSDLSRKVMQGEQVTEAEFAEKETRDTIQFSFRYADTEKEYQDITDIMVEYYMDKDHMSVYSRLGYIDREKFKEFIISLCKEAIWKRKQQLIAQSVKKASDV